MATTDCDLDIHLFQELRTRYPEVPEQVVTGHMRQHHNDRDKCMEVLSNESPKFLFGGNVENVTSHMQTFNIGQAETRQRSDSGSSGVSSTSNCSASSVSSWPPVNPNTGGMSYQSHVEGRPLTAPVEPRDLNQFFISGRNPSSIPNIHCDAYNPGNSSHGSNVHAGSVPPSGSNSNKGLRQIQVFHVQTSEADRLPHGEVTPSVNSQGQYVYKIQVSPRPGSYGNQDQYQQQQAPPQIQHQHSYPASSTWRSNSPSNYNTGTFNYGPHGNYINQSYGNDGIFSLDRYSNQRQTPDSSPQGHGNNISFQNQYSPTQNYPTTQQNQFNRPNHSSQATIYIRNTSAAAKLDTPGDRTPIYSPGNQGFPISMHMSQSEPYLSSQSNSFLNPVSSPGNPNQQPQPTQNYNKPLFVKLESYGPDSSRYVPSEPQGASSGGNMFSNIGGAVNPPSNTYVAKLHSAGGPSQGDNGQVFIHYPPVPNTNACRVPGHPPVPLRTPSIENEHMNKNMGNPEIETRHLSHATFPPLVSPASSHSSLSSESSQREGQRRRSGSLQEEAAYTQALLSFQKERMCKLKTDLESELRKLSKLRAEVTQMEKNMLDRQKRSSNRFPSVEDVSKLREKNLRLQTDIQMFTREIDMFNNGQTPLGVLDPLEQQNFYKNMNTGQRGSIYSQPVQTPSRDTPPPIPPRIHHVPPPPPPQPPTGGSGDSDGDGEQWNCSACTFLNHPALNKCECCEMPRMNVQQQQPPTEQPEDNFSDWTYVDRDPVTQLPIEAWLHISAEELMSYPRFEHQRPINDKV